MRLLALAFVLAAFTPGASADPLARFVEDAATIAADHPLVGGVDDALVKCATGAAATGSAVAWLEIGKAGKVSAARVHGAGKLDGCLEKALAKGAVTDKLDAAIVVVGHVDVMEPQKSAYLPSPRVSTTPVVLDAHGSKWQLTATKVAYTANRMLDITKSLDDISDAVAGCAAKRTVAAHGLVWMDGRAIVRTGAAGYDDCLARALSKIKLPAPESAFWLALDIAPPTEALAARTDKASLSHPQAVHDAMTTAVRSRKLDLLDCLNGRKGATLTKVTVALKATKLNVKQVSTGDPEANKCVRGKLKDIAIPNASASEQLDLEVALEDE